MDLCDEVIGAWRGHAGAVAAMTLVWGHPLVSGGRIATAELADLAVDQCELIEERFTLIAPDDYRHDLLEIKLFGAKGQELARESLYAGMTMRRRRRRRPRPGSREPPHSLDGYLGFTLQTERARSLAAPAGTCAELTSCTHSSRTTLRSAVASPVAAFSQRFFEFGLRARRDR